MRKFIIFFAAILLPAVHVMADRSPKEKTVKIRIMETSDVHGSFFPYDFITRQDKAGSLARVYQHVEDIRREMGQNVILMDNGDLLQGQPVVYYSNYIDTKNMNLGAQVMNFMHYDVQNFGNHDVETGHAVYDKWTKEVNCTVLGANILNVNNNRNCYVKPFTIIERDGVKIAVLGMLTPAIPSWLGNSLWSGIEFRNMLHSCQEWMEYLKENIHPDVIVGLFHSGLNGGIATSAYEENATERIAREVPGFDVIFYGHDHQKMCEQITNNEGGKVWLLNPANNAMNVAEAELSVIVGETKKGPKVKSVEINGFLTNVENTPVNQAFMNHFDKYISEVKRFVNRKIGYCDKTITTHDAFFGSSAFIDYIHNMQLALTGADVSFNAPLTLDAKINKGNVYVSDMFNLYKFENQLSVVRMTGEEIRKHLEMSYDMWVNTMKSADDHLLKIRGGDNERTVFQNRTYNFDSAAGIDYEVDVTKPDGQKVRILRMSDGRKFDEKAWYKVAMNSYRACGGGELLTRGAGIDAHDLSTRITYTSEKDLRFYLMQRIEKDKLMQPKANNNWKFVPENIVKPAAAKDRKLVFGE